MIRHAHIDDAERIEEIVQQSLDLKYVTALQSPMGIKKRKHWIEHRAKNHPVFVYEEDGQLIGYIALSAYRPQRPSLDRTALISYFVDNKHFQKGVASALLQYLINYLKTTSIKVIIAIILDGNERSIKLTEKFGFEQWAYLPDVFEAYDKVLSQVYMGKVLDQ